MKSGSYSISKAIEELGGDYSENDIRLVRIKILSDKCVNSEVVNNRQEAIINHDDDLPF